MSTGGAQLAGGAGHQHEHTHAPRLGRRMARFNKQVLNKVTIHFAGALPYMGIVIHAGRRSGNVYRTPVNVFRMEDGFRFALTYGRDAEWVRNAQSFGAVRLITRHREYELTAPHLVNDPERHGVPWPLRVILRLVRVSEFLDFKALR